MFYSILLVAGIATSLFVLKRWQKLPDDQRKDFAMKAALWGAASIVVILVLAGRAHWLMGVLAALIALASRAAQLARFVPMFKEAFSESRSSKPTPPIKTNAMTRHDAAEILGVNSTATPEEVRLAHKKLMQKIHPDRGGTDALAAQINQAKEILLAS